MKKNVLIFCISLLCNLNIAAQQNNDFIAPQLTDKESCSMILLPDPQTYIKFDYNQPLFDLMMAWIVRNIEPLNIGLVLCTGDLVEQNNLLTPDGINGNQPSKSQWEAVSSAFGKLDGKVPYILATGNHDYGIRAAENRMTFYDKYFPVNKNWLNQKLLRDAGTDCNNMPSLTNAIYEYITPQGKKFLIMVLEFAPRDETLEWAKSIVDNEKYAAHAVILLTHSYLSADNKHIEKEGYLLSGPNYGAAIWEKLVKPSKNICMVLAGHIGKPDDPREHLAFREDKNAAGKTVYQMVFNAQALGGGWHGNGGDGWLRILEFMPDGRTVKVKTFSPLFAASPTTQQYSWRTADYDEFVFVLE
ncbi:MAG: metallophosphoesterase [Tannerella sp.]|jgi:hypothetical protein|nr:metallophosphoesterase [Tannerella sp.]